MEILDEYPFLLKHENFQKREVKSLKMYFTSIHDGERDQLRSEPNIIANFHDNGYFVYLHYRSQEAKAKELVANAEKNFSSKNYDESITLWKSAQEEYTRAKDLASDRGETEILDLNLSLTKIRLVLVFGKIKNSINM